MPYPYVTHVQLLPITPIRSLSLTGVLAMLALLPAQAAVTVTIDTLAQTVTWSGSATSDTFVVPENDITYFRLGMGSWIGGTLVASSGGGSIEANLGPGSVSGVFFSDSFSTGQIVVNGARDSFYTDLGTVSNFGPVPGGPASVSVTISGDGQAHSYAGLAAEVVDYLESLNGTQLYFQDDQGGAGVFNIGGPAAQMVVVPEPSSALLLLAAPFLTLRRRRRGVVG